VRPPISPAATPDGKKDPAGRASTAGAPARTAPPAPATQTGRPQTSATASKSKNTGPAARNNQNASAIRSLPTVQGVTVKSRTPERPATQRTTQEPAWLKHLQKELPPYADELLAFLLLGAGLLSFLTLLSPESGEMGSAWSVALRQVFGLGAFMIPTLILAAGALLLLPKIGVVVRINWLRLAAGEITFVLLLANIHAGIRAAAGEMGTVEAFAQAMEGKGGGLVGWAIQDLVYMLLGNMITGIVLLSLLAISMALLLGVQREHLLDSLDRLQQRFIRLAEQTEPPPPLGPAGGMYNVPYPAMAGAVEVDPNAPMLVELPAIPGRPSIVTGETGAGAVAVLRPGSRPAGQTPFRRPDTRPSSRIDRLRARHMEKYQEIDMRFRLEEVRDRRRTRKREAKLPPLDLLEDTSFERPSDEEINMSAVIIEETVADFGMQVKVVGVKAGPTVTQYAVQPFIEVEQDGEKVIQRVRVTRVAGLAKDLSLSLSAPSVRIQAPVPGTSYIGIEVPNAQPGIVSLRPIMESEQFFRIRGPLGLALGREVDGTPHVADLGKMPHLLIGGTTGSGKSVCLRSMATCLVANNRPDQLRLIMIDPKMVELVRFNGLPHLLGRVEVQMDRIIGVLRWVTREMDRRYRMMEEALARNIDVFNRNKHYKHRLPRIVVMVDELAELMMAHPDETEHLITRLAQMARATGIHLAVATQRPSTDVVTGLIKANFPARISFAVASGVDSRVIIDSVGAEDLIGKGDMLYQSPEAAAPVRLQGSFVSDTEMERIVDYWVENWEEEEEAAPWERALSHQAIIEETDEMLIEAIKVVQSSREASASMLQRRLNVGYPRAGRIIDALHRLGVVGPEETGGRTREVLIQEGEDPLDYILQQRRGRL
jgi:S-DNA-T family DNA segregation ATPase FtsK/SpoIIIE